MFGIRVISVYMDLDISKLMDYLTSSNIESVG